MRRRKEKEIQRFHDIMIENEENQRKLKNEAERERIEVFSYDNLGYQSSGRIYSSSR